MPNYSEKKVVLKPVKILNLTENSQVYTSNVYLVLGSWNGLPDVNTMVDVGRDPLVIDAIKNTSTGVGKKRVQPVILTHSHYDHTGMLPVIRTTFAPVVYAFSKYHEGVDRSLKDGDELKCGDRMFEVIHTPGHSSDSICLYCKEERVLFAGDTPLLIHRPGDTYHLDFVQALEKICRREIETIYFGHGQPLTHDCHDLLLNSLDNVQKSIIR
jgi:glyoxylase-like metal-dependent hydrolase (beta-lactamase superfamily II)